MSEPMTEKQVREIMSVYGVETLIEEMRERSWIAPEPVEPMRELAREIVAQCTSYPSAGIMRLTPEEVALTALNRGREIERAERPKVTADILTAAYDLTDTWEQTADYINRQLYGDDA